MISTIKKCAVALMGTMMAFSASAAYTTDGVLNYDVLQASKKTAQVVRIEDTKAVNIVVPETVMIKDVEYTVIMIGGSAFLQLTSLETISLPSTLQAIGLDAFRGCTNLREVTCRMTTPFAAASSGFETEVLANATLYVPEGLTESYKKLAPWKSFANIQERDMTNAAPAISAEVLSEAEVYTLTGQKVSASESLPAGIYVVRQGNKTVKVRL